jgi:hypothetical protein
MAALVATSCVPPAKPEALSVWRSSTPRSLGRDRTDCTVGVYPSVASSQFDLDGRTAMRTGFGNECVKLQAASSALGSWRLSCR